MSGAARMRRAKLDFALLGLAWADVTHHRLRTFLSALAVGIGIMLMLISRGLAAGSMDEVNQRMQSVDAELVVLPAQESIIFMNGAPFRGAHERALAREADERGPLADAVIPVFFAQVQMGGQLQRVFGVDPAQMKLFLGPRRVLEGKLFDRARDFARRVQAGATRPAEPAAEEQYLADGLELVIDARLQRVGNYHIGDEVKIMGQTFRIVGVVEAGVAGRVFAPLPTLREIVVGGEPSASMYFLKVRRDLAAAAAFNRFQDLLGSDAKVDFKSDYGRLLQESFASVGRYMAASSGLALVVCFLGILLALYMMVLARAREIAILKALGVTRLGLVLLCGAEGLFISLGGVILGIGLSLITRGLLAIVEPLLTVELAAGGILLAALVGVVGGTLSALYPGYRAARLDPALALCNE